MTACDCCYAEGHRTPCERPTRPDVPPHGVATPHGDAYPCGAVYTTDAWGRRSRDYDRTDAQRIAWGLPTH